ncbi:prephenate dehydrogenase (NADP(+)) [Ranunculus cassubicifolius]
MASFHLCNTNRVSNLYKSQATLPTFVSSPTPNVINPIKLYTNLENKSLVSKHTHAIDHIDKSIKPSMEYSPVKEAFPLKIGIIGLGEFGQFLAQAFNKQGHNVLGTSRSDYSKYCEENGIEFFQKLDDMCEAQPDVVLVCSSILSTADVVRKIPFHKLKPDTIIADVLSVKEFPKKLLMDVVPESFGILCTHPMFGKFSGKNSWEGLRFVYDKVRVSENSAQEKKCEQFLNIFQDEGCKMVEMSCETHDHYAAESQFITHTIARVLSIMELESTPIDTKGYETLMELVQNTTSHSSDLYEGLYLYNVNSGKMIDRLEKAFDVVKQNLFGKLRETLRKQMEEAVAVQKPSELKYSSHFLPTNNNVEGLSAFTWITELGNKSASVEHRNEVHHANV